jgi:transcriptional regulator with XRE-family HTH domain
MDRREFGTLITALREDLGWTQAQLALAADELPPAISNIERGLRKHFEPGLLFRLSNALQLTMLERREFFLAASGLDEEDGDRAQPSGAGDVHFDARETIERLQDLVGRLQLPAHLTDVYSDIITANAAFFALFELRPEQAAELSGIPGGTSAIHIIYGAGMPFRRLVAAKWEQMALSGMQAFRQANLRYRATPYFKYLMVHFRNPRIYPSFERHWRLSGSSEEDRYTSAIPFEFRHADYGWLKYLVSRSVTSTPHGNLFLRQYLPADEPTAQLFLQLVQREEHRAYRWSSWPEKTMI